MTKNRQFHLFFVLIVNFDEFLSKSLTSHILKIFLIVS